MPATAVYRIAISLIRALTALTVVKTNDADHDGVFHDSEEAANPGDSVTFKIVVTNTGDVPVAIDSVSDVYGAVTAAECPNLLGTVLAVGESVPCTFTIAGCSMRFAARASRSKRAACAASPPHAASVLSAKRVPRSKQRPRNAIS